MRGSTVITDPYWLVMWLNLNPPKIIEPLCRPVRVGKVVMWPHELCVSTLLDPLDNIYGFQMHECSCGTFLCLFIVKAYKRDGAETTRLPCDNAAISHEILHYTLVVFFCFFCLFSSWRTCCIHDFTNIQW